MIHGQLFDGDFLFLFLFPFQHLFLISKQMQDARAHRVPVRQVCAAVETCQ